MPVTALPAKLSRRLLLALSAFAALPAMSHGELRILTEEFPPYNLTENGRITGFSTEVVEAVLHETGIAAPIQSMPWARAYDIALKGENVLIYSITRTAQREKLFKWVGVVAPSDWYLFARRGSGVTLARLEDAKALRTATVKEDAGEQYLVANGFALGSQLQSSNKYESNYEKLRMGRVDLWIANDLVAHYLSRHAGDDPAEVLERALPLPDLGGSGGLYMAFSLRTPDATVERFRRGLEAVKRKGVYDALKRKWL